MRKIYDGFTFFNELDLLELRLEELYDYVDYFIIVESDHTFTNIPKPYYFDDSKQRYVRFMDKIKHVKLQSNKHDNPWQNEHEQRNGIILGYDGANDDDYIMVSDVDEIPRRSALEPMRYSDKDIHAMCTPFFYFKLNYVSIHPHCYIPLVIGAKSSIFKRLGAQGLRATRDCYVEAPFTYENYRSEVVHHGGWHFGYLGDSEFIKQKFVSFSHASDVTEEYVRNYTVESELIPNSTERFFVNVDDYFPMTVVNNLEKYRQYIVDGEFQSIRELLASKGIGVV